MNERKIKGRALLLHKKIAGKIGIVSKVEVNNEDDLSLAYTPGVAEPCKVIAQDAIKNADVFIGVSGSKELTGEMVRTMNRNSIVFALANPVEIYPEEALEASAAVVGTGRSDYPNQVNNVPAFPGIFRGALDVRATDIIEEVKLAAAYAISSLVSDKELHPNYIVPNALDSRVGDRVAAAVPKQQSNQG